jgi:4-hydroxybenzoate polyprenyltransferase
MVARPLHACGVVLGFCGVALIEGHSRAPETKRRDEVWGRVRKDRTEMSNSAQTPTITQLKALFWILRPRQWVKNLFVVAPLVFSKHLLDPTQVARSAAAFLLFCLISGVVYIINDLKDIDADRSHPVKKNRPLPAGRLRPGWAKRFAGGLFVLTALCAVWLAPIFAALLGAYWVLNLLYTFWLKRVPYLDVACIASGFLLRVLAGAAVLLVTPSIWLIVCTGLLAAFLGLGKRASELSLLGKQAWRHRPVLKRYRLSHLKIAMAVLGVTTLIGYIAYTLSPHTRQFFGTRQLYWTIPFPAFGLFRFAQLAMRKEAKDSPTDRMLRDVLFLINMVCWAVVVIGIIYFL